MKWKSNQDMAPTFPYNFENVILCNYVIPRYLFLELKKSL